MSHLPTYPELPSFSDPGFVLRPWQADAMFGLVNKIKKRRIRQHSGTSTCRQDGVVTLHSQSFAGCWEER